jgi:hypothetical protein
MTRLVRCALVTGALLPVVSFGHHSTFGRFDRGRVAELEGVVTEIEWRNPHAHLTIEIAGDGSETEIWDLETGAATQLERSGVKRELFAVGDHVRAAGWPPLTETKELYATNLLAPDGTELLLNVNAVPRWTANPVGDQSFQSKTEGDPSRPELGIFRVWSHTDVSTFLFPEDTSRGYDLSRYPLTETARTALGGFNRATDNPTRNCMPKGMPTIMEQPYPMEIVQDGRDIVFRIEEYDTLRTIHMNEKAPPADSRPSLHGYSVGRWDGTTLVVTTTRVSYPWFDQVGIPQSEQSVLVERFSPTADGSRLDYELVVDDPVNFTEPVRLEKYWLNIPGREVQPYECIE